MILIEKKKNKGPKNNKKQNPEVIQSKTVYSLANPETDNDLKNLTIDQIFDIGLDSDGDVNTFAAIKAILYHDRLSKVLSGHKGALAYFKSILFKGISKSFNLEDLLNTYRKDLENKPENEEDNNAQDWEENSENDFYDDTDYDDVDASETKTSSVPDQILTNLELFEDILRAITPENLEKPDNNVIINYLDGIGKANIPLNADANSYGKIHNLLYKLPASAVVNDPTSPNYSLIFNKDFNRIVTDPTVVKKVLLKQSEDPSGKFRQKIRSILNPDNKDFKSEKEKLDYIKLLTNDYSVSKSDDEDDEDDVTNSVKAILRQPKDVKQKVISQIEKSLK